MKIKLLRSTSKAPEIKTSGSVGYDCFLDLGSLGIINGEPVIKTIISPGEKKKIGLGFSAAVPAGHAGFVFPRSGSGSKGIHLANVVAVIDQDYRGEWICNVHNTTNEELILEHGERYFQMVVTPVYTETLEVVDELDETVRGTGGFGSTGK